MEPPPPPLLLRLLLPLAASLSCLLFARASAPIGVLGGGIGAHGGSSSSILPTSNHLGLGNLINGHARRLLHIGDGYKHAAFLQASTHASNQNHTKRHKHHKSTQKLTPVPAPSPSPLNAPPQARASLSPSASIPAISPGLHPLAAPPQPLSTLPSPPPHKHSWKNYSIVTAGSAVFLVMAAASVMYCRAKKLGSVKPWATGLSEQLQRAFVTGVPALKRSELQAACEDFSNIVGSMPSCMLYKGTLSSGVEIAVVSSSITSIKDWSKECESHFRRRLQVYPELATRIS